MNSRRAGDPLFSIVTVTLDCAADAVDTARSVQSQDSADYEYIVKDGGSTDTTVEQLASVGVETVLRCPDRGVYDAMNQALALCHGEYVCFMNAGDVFASPGVLNAVGSLAASTNWPDLVYGDARTCSVHPALNSNDERAPSRRLYYPSLPSRFWLYRRVICHQACFVRRSVLQDLEGFDPRYAVSSAYHLLLRLLLKRKVRYAHLPEEVVIYKGGGISDSGDPRQATERAAILRELFGPVERTVYGTVYRMMSGPARWCFFHLVFPLLPGRIQDRVFGW